MYFFIYTVLFFNFYKFKNKMLMKLFLFISLYNLQDSFEEIYIYPEEPLVMDNICAISGKTKKILGSTTIEKNYLYLKRHCAENEKCYKTGKDIYQCGNKILFHKIGEECGVNEECYTGLCFYGKCGSIGNDEDCTGENDPNNKEKVCNPGYWCYEHDSLNHLFKCVPYVGEGELYDEVDGRLCKIGLAPHEDADHFERCRKYGSLSNGDISPNPILCQTGFSLGYDPVTEQLVNDAEKTKCFTVVTDSPCEYDSIKGDYFCKPIVDGLDNFVVEIEIKCTNIKSIYICPYTKGKENSFKEYISRLNSINIDDVYRDENKYHSVGYGDNKLSQSYQKYHNYDELYSMGFIDNNGNINRDKQAEWEFFWRFNDSSFINHTYFFCLVFLILF